MPGALLPALLRVGSKVQRSAKAAQASLGPQQRGAASAAMAALVKRIISTAKAPAAIGPYSQAVLVDRTMYIAGQIGMDPSNGQLVPGGVKEEAKQALKNVGEILKAADCDYSNVVKTTVLMADMKDFDDVNEVYKQFFKYDFPARAAYQVAALPKGARVEIEAVAISGPLRDAKHDTKGNL
ncbi:2-iminobutanoate/2-iminopropanoate deaminase [Eublepharis macularius]|uniref:2-iminobutanoate/2-iminopropanoate deaminase n=1 Tax=Eublepharis macularius TaxID=481883 RepID=A0AA97JPV9_EUBMA|nr:2-iminobutanoate/2-iminopropanoate deaminase [Eublepharis macularius]